MQSTKRVTLLDVAVRAGVSTTTASYILNDRSAQMRISPDTERRVREAVADLGYRPNRSARTLRTANTATIGLVSDFLAGGHYASQMLLGASAAAREVDHLLMIGETDGDLDVEALYIEELLDRQVDGIIYATRTASRIRVPESLRQRRTVLLNCFDPTADLPAVLPDEVVRGTVGGPPARRPRHRRRRVRRRRGPHPPRDRGTRAADRDPRGPGRRRSGAGRRGGVRVVGAGRLRGRVALAGRRRRAPRAHLPQRPGDDGGLPGASERGLTVPGDVAVVSFDGSELATWLRPPVVSVALPFAELGAQAVRLLTGAEPIEPIVTRVAMTVQEGESLPDLTS